MMPPKNGNNGVALIIVLWVLSFLSTIAGEFCFTMRTEINMTRNIKEEAQAYYIALAGIHRAIAGLTAEGLLDGKMERVNEAETIASPAWRANVEMPPIVFGEGRYKVWIRNEGGVVNLNKADRLLLRTLMSTFDLNDHEKDVIVDSILDWRDKDHLHRVNGAEDSYYLSLPEPYDCKDNAFESIHELLYVRGMRPDIFYGGLKDLVTVYPQQTKEEKPGLLERRKESFNFNRVNVNSAPFRLLRSLPEMTEDLCSQLVEYRREGDFESYLELIEIVGTEVFQAIRPYITLNILPFFTVEAVGMIQGSDTQRGLSAVVKIRSQPTKGFRIVQWFDTLQNDVFSTFNVDRTQAKKGGVFVVSN